MSESTSLFVSVFLGWMGVNSFFAVYHLRRIANSLELMSDINRD